MKPLHFALLLTPLLMSCKENHETQGHDIQSDSMVSEPITANFPNLRVVMSKPGVREGAIGVDFPITPNKSNWNKLSLGINYRSYTTRIEFIEKLPHGDKYRITIYKPVPEKLDPPEKEQIIFDETLVLTDKRTDLLEVEGVEFYTQT